MEEILHQLVDGKHPIVIPLFTVFQIVPNSYQLVQDFFHPQYVQYDIYYYSIIFMYVIYIGCMYVYIYIYRDMDMYLIVFVV